MNLNNSTKTNAVNKISITKIRTEQKAKYEPLILKALKPIFYIRKRSNNDTTEGEMPQEKKFDKLYTLLQNENFLIQALGNIQSNKGSLTPGVDQSTFDGMNLYRINQLATSLKNGTFKFRPFRRKMVEKPVVPGQPKKFRPLGIPNFNDRIVQEGIRMILDAIYEPIFNRHNYNYGFRAGKSCHEAVKHLQRNGTACDYAIEGDIKAAFDNVDFDIMINILKKKIRDKKFLDLILQGFKCGMLEQGTYKDTLLGVPQGGIASPILFNIYMHEFDLFIHKELTNEINNKNATEHRIQHGVNNPKYKAISQRINRHNKSIKRLLTKNTDFELLPSETQNKIKSLHKQLKQEYKTRIKTPAVLYSKRNIRIVYTRYADDWIILTNANRNYCNKLKDLIKDFLLNSLKLTLSPEKTKITNLKQKKACFLGFSFNTYRTTKITKKFNRLVRTAGYEIRIGIDMDRMINRLITKGFCTKKSGNRPTSKPSYTVLNIEQIINTYNYILLGVANYFFPPISTVKDIIRVIYILEYSAYMTIAQKYNTKISKIREKYGKPLIVTITQIEKIAGKPDIQTTKILQLYSYLELKKLTENLVKNYNMNKFSNYDEITDIFNPMYKINWRTLRNLNSACVICGTTENVEMHHIHSIRKGKVVGFAQVMKQLNRRTIPLCHTHHMAAEKGLLSDIKKEDLYHITEFLA